MSLTMGSGPFGPKSAGTFNFSRQGASRVIYWEPSPKRFRVEIGGEIVADSCETHLLHEQGYTPRIYFPRGSVAMDRLTPSERTTRCPLKGVASYWSVGDRKNVGWSYEDPIESAPPIAGWISFDLEQADAWYEEDEQGYAHPRDPYHRVDVRRTDRRVVVRCGDTIVADATQPSMLFETALAPRYYLAPGDVRTELLEKSDTVSQCPYKGPGQHWHLVLGDRRIEDAAWTLPSPIGDSTAIPDWWSFYPEKVSVEVDGEPLPRE